MSDLLQCSNCGLWLAPDLFAVEKRTKRGRQSRCRECTNMAQKLTRLNPSVRLREKEYRDRTRSTPEVKRKRQAYGEQYSRRPEVQARRHELAARRAEKGITQQHFKRYNAKHPERRSARVALCNAIRDGRIARRTCEVCGAWAEAHHDDYSETFRGQVALQNPSRGAAHMQTVMDTERLDLPSASFSLRYKCLGARNLIQACLKAGLITNDGGAAAESGTEIHRALAGEDVELNDSQEDMRQTLTRIELNTVEALYPGLMLYARERRIWLRRGSNPCSAANMTLPMQTRSFGMRCGVRTQNRPFRRSTPPNATFKCATWLRSGHF